MTRRLPALVAAALLVSGLSLAGASPAGAATGSVTYASGVDAVEVSFDGGATWGPAYPGDAGLPGPFPGSTWVFPTPNPHQGFGDPQIFRYRVTFELPAGFTSASLAGETWSDDNSGDIFLNGAQIAEITTYVDGGPYVFENPGHTYGTTDSGLFVAGTNVVELVSVNLGGSTGIDFVGTVTYELPDPPTPEEQAEDLVELAATITAAGPASSQATAALELLAAGDPEGAVHHLGILLKQLDNGAGKKLSAADREALRAAATALIASIGG